MVRAFGIDMPKNKREALAVARSIDGKLAAIRSRKSKRGRCIGISRVFKVVKNMHKESRDLYLKDSNKDMRDVSLIFEKWMRANGCILNDAR
jgi:hypothetical protein